MQCVSVHKWIIRAYVQCVAHSLTFSLVINTEELGPPETHTYSKLKQRCTPENSQLISSNQWLMKPLGDQIFFDEKYTQFFRALFLRYLF
jgi:hypothetical protein